MGTSAYAKPPKMRLDYDFNRLTGGNQEKVRQCHGCGAIQSSKECEYCGNPAFEKD